MTRCLVCGEGRRPVAAAIGVCGPCLREGSARARKLAVRAHSAPRRDVCLPEVAPREHSSAACRLCVNECQPGEGQRGLCGTRQTAGGRVKPIVGTAQKAAVTWWHNELPTNCCAQWVCPASSACGYPRYSYAPKLERGYKSLAAGYYGCTFDCLYCQSWQTRSIDGGPRRSASELAAAVDDQTSCICFFGGDPTPQLAHALAAARLARRRAVAKRRVLRICFETNGAMQPAALRTMTDLVLESGGCIKFDLKAHHGTVHQALCGASNGRTLENFAYLAGRRSERPEVPLAIATTPLVPGYVDVEEVSAIAGFLASLGADIPYTLLAFFPCFYLSDLPHTSVQQADRCLAAARAAGLTRVRPCARELLRDAPEEAPKPRRRRRRVRPAARG